MIPWTKRRLPFYEFLVDFKKNTKSKVKVFKEFKKNKINLQVHYIPVNMQPYYKKKYGFSKKNFMNSIRFYESEVSLPIYFDLDKKKLEYIKKVCKKIFKIK